MSEDSAVDGNSRQGPTFDTTGMEGGEAGTAITFGTANIEHLSIQTNQFGSDDSGSSKQEPKQQEKGPTVHTTGVKDGQVDNAATVGHAQAGLGQQGSDGSGQTKQEPNDHDQEKDDFGDAVLVSISGRTLKTIQRLDSIPVQDGEVSVRGTYSNQNVETTGKQYAASQSESGIYSKSSRGEPSRRVKQVVADLQRDEDVDGYGKERVVTNVVLVTGCDECRMMRDDRDPDVNTNQVVIHIDVVTLFGYHWGERREMRREKVLEVARKISAVRNSGGGCILCHISGRDSQDRNLKYFDHMFLPSSKLPLGEEEIYSHTIQREWYGDTDFVIITVPHAACVCTVSVNSYIAEYDGCRDVSLPQLRTLLFGKQAAGHGPPLIRGMGDLQEGVDKKYRSRGGVPVRASEQFDAYRLQLLISAFSKNRSGGSLYIGVREEAIMHSGYRSRVPKVEGCPIPSRHHTAYTEELKTLVRENMMIIPNIHTKQPCDLQDLVGVAFHHVREDNYVIEISVGTVNGCVFTDKGGPFAYKLDEKGSLCRMSWQEWMQKFRAGPRPT